MEIPEWRMESDQNVVTAVEKVHQVKMEVSKWKEVRFLPPYDSVMGRSLAGQEFLGVKRLVIEQGTGNLGS